MDILKRELAPIPAEAWMEIDEQAIRSLKAILSARKVIDVSGPMGTDFPGVPEGRLEIPKKQPKNDVTYGIHFDNGIVRLLRLTAIHRQPLKVKDDARKCHKN